MTRIIVTTREGDRRQIEVMPSQSIMEAIRDDGIDILAICGGVCSCATCHIYIDSEHGGAIPQMTSEESDLLEGSEHRKATSRLSCQIQMTESLDGMQVIVAPAD